MPLMLITSSWIRLDKEKHKVCPDVGSEISRVTDAGLAGWSAILALKQAFRESMSTVQFVMEETLVEEHQSNGTTEVTQRVPWKRD